MKKTLATVLSVLAMTLAFAGTSLAADSEFRIEPYLWAAGLTGTIGTPASGPGLPEGAGSMRRSGTSSKTWNWRAAE